MRSYRVACFLIAMAFGTTTESVGAQQLGTHIQTTGSAHSWLSRKQDVKISMGGRVVSNRSSLRLEWYMVVDSTMGVTFDEPVGAKAHFNDTYFRYESDMKMLALRQITAFEVRILTFNIWKQFTGTLTFTQLEDMRPGQDKGFKRYFGVFGQSRLREHFTTIVYVARVRLANGETIVADQQPVLDLAQTIQSDLTIQDLEPEQEQVPLVPRS